MSVAVGAQNVSVGKEDAQAHNACMNICLGRWVHR